MKINAKKQEEKALKRLIETEEQLQETLASTATNRKYAKKNGRPAADLNDQSMYVPTATLGRKLLSCLQVNS